MDALRLFEPTGQLDKRAFAEVVMDKNCPQCGSPVLRLAMRERHFPYHWMPYGYICSACDSVYVQVGK